MQWRSEPKCRTGSTIKVPPFPPLKFAYKNLKWKKIIFVLSKDIRYITSWTSESNTNRQRSHFSYSFMGLAFAACSPSHHVHFLFFIPSLHLHLWTRHISLNFISCCFSVCRKTHHLALIVYHFKGSNKRPKKIILWCLIRERMAWYLLYRCSLNIYVCLYVM